VTFDGVDIRDCDLEQFRSAIGLVPRRAHLFSGTVADNLRYGAAPGQVVTDTEMWEALRIAAADDFVRARPTACRCPSHKRHHLRRVRRIAGGRWYCCPIGNA
jgi:ATP-binding cassette subfamily B protein